MAYSYLIPTLLDAPEGYDVTACYAPAMIAERLVGGRGRVRWMIRVYHEGKIVEQRERVIDFTPEAVHEMPPLVEVWRGTQYDYQGRPGYIENNFSIADDISAFSTKIPVGTYGFYSCPGKPSFRGDADFKFGSPPVIATVARFKRLVENYPSCRLDRVLGYGESLVFINPYSRPILAQVRSHDGRELPRFRVNAQSAGLLSLESLLRPDEENWAGRIQITANNRSLIFHLRHQFGVPSNIVDHEHLDPFRADVTHVPAFRFLRQWTGRFFKMRYGIHVGSSQ